MIPGQARPRNRQPPVAISPRAGTVHRQLRDNLYLCCNPRSPNVRAAPRFTCTLVIHQDDRNACTPAPLGKPTGARQAEACRPGSRETLPSTLAGGARFPRASNAPARCFGCGSIADASGRPRIRTILNTLRAYRGPMRLRKHAPGHPDHLRDTSGKNPGCIFPVAPPIRYS
jgi:hypothetical protein